MHVLEDSVIFATLQAEVKGNKSGRRQRRAMVRNTFIGSVIVVFFVALYFLHGMIGDLEQERLNGGVQLPGSEISKAVKKSLKGDESVLIEFKVSHLDGKSDEKGVFVIKTEPSWSKLGAQRVVDLTNDDFWSGCRFFRVIDGFMAQFGINGDPAKNRKWEKPIMDEGVKGSNKRGVVSFAMAGPGTRGHQLFINFRDNKSLDGQGFAPIGSVVEGMDVVDRIYKTGEGAPHGKGPSQAKLRRGGNEYLHKEFPQLSYIVSAKVK